MAKEFHDLLSKPQLNHPTSAPVNDMNTKHLACVT
jgi:hypothetical protein